MIDASLPVAAATNRARCASWLYDRGGHYRLRRLFIGQWVDVRDLGRDEAMTYRTAQDEALELIFDH